MARGRPAGSAVRQNIVEFLHAIGEAYGYDIYKQYLAVFPKVTMRTVYYHLRKGLETGELRIARVERQRGEYSWGPEAERVYYTTGPKAQPRGDQRVKEYLATRKGDV